MQFVPQPRRTQHPKLAQPARRPAARFSRLSTQSRTSHSRFRKYPQHRCRQYSARSVACRRISCSISRSRSSRRRYPPEQKLRPCRRSGSHSHRLLDWEEVLVSDDDNHPTLTLVHSSAREPERHASNNANATAIAGDLIDEAALAARLGVSRATLQSWRYAGRGPSYIKIGRLIRYRNVDVDRFLRENTRLTNHRL